MTNVQIDAMSEREQWNLWCRLGARIAWRKEDEDAIEADIRTDAKAAAAGHGGQRNNREVSNATVTAGSE